MKSMCRCFKLLAHGEPLAEVLFPIDDPGPREVIVRVTAAGVCHSDLFLQDGFIDAGGDRKLDMARSVNVPRVLGHEIAGVVAAVGSGVRATGIGDAVVVYPWIGCGRCPLCLSNRENLCGNPHALGVNRDGGFSDHVRVPDERYLIPMGRLAPEQAAPYACSGLTAFSALKKLLPADPGERLLVIGAGGVGLSGVRLANTVLGVAPIVADIDRSKWPLARHAGAVETIDPSERDALRTMIKATGGGVSAVIDFVGNGASFTFGFGALAKGGRMVSVGLIGGTTPFTPAMIALKAVTLIGSYVGNCDELRELLALAQTHSLPPLPVIPMPLDAVNQALDELRAGGIAGRAVLTP
jgi:D-arabinose 1-dehydrogenase-like Zn-dependent alcohol dehydrogenase